MQLRDTQIQTQLLERAHISLRFVIVSKLATGFESGKNAITALWCKVSFRYIHLYAKALKLHYLYSHIVDIKTKTLHCTGVRFIILVSGGFTIAAVHGLWTPNEGINQRYLKNWADVADKICFGRTYKFGIGIEFSAVQWRQFPHRVSVVRGQNDGMDAELGVACSLEMSCYYTTLKVI